jgi:transposase
MLMGKPSHGTIVDITWEGTVVVKKYVVDLTEVERQQLLDLTKKGRVSARKLTRAHVLLLADEGRNDKAIAAALHVSVPTVERIRNRFVTGNVEHALKEQARPGARRKLDGKQEAFLVATACSTPPDGRSRWTMQLLADRLVELEQVDSISDDTVRRTLKKTISSHG